MAGRRNQGYLYLLKARNQNLYKIGITKKPAQRFKQLDVGGRNLLLECVLCNEYQYEEKRLHHKFKQYRLPQTEYFELPSVDSLREEYKSLEYKEPENIIETRRRDEEAEREFRQILETPTSAKRKSYKFFDMSTWTQTQMNIFIVCCIFIPFTFPVYLLLGALHIFIGGKL